MSNDLVDIKSVSKFYGKVLGLNDITVGFGQGITGLLGPNGAGKSTMIKLITGQIKPNMGAVTVLGQKAWNNPQLNRMIGYCPEHEAFYEKMTGLQFIIYLTRLNGISKEKATDMAKRALRTVNMDKDMNRQIGGYSKGMKQRTKIAQSLVHDPDLLILDEPLAGMDPLGRIKIIELLKDLKNRGKNIIISSHVLYEIERITEEVVIINKGKLIAKGNIHNIRDSMDRFPLTIRIKTGKRKKLANLLMGKEGIISISYEGGRDTLLVRTRDSGAYYPMFQELIIKSDIEIEEIDSPDDNLDAIFKYLVD